MNWLWSLEELEHVWSTETLWREIYRVKPLVAVFETTIERREKLSTQQLSWIDAFSQTFSVFYFLFYVIFFQKHSGVFRICAILISIYKMIHSESDMRYGNIRYLMCYMSGLLISIFQRFQWFVIILDCKSESEWRYILLLCRSSSSCNHAAM